MKTLLLATALIVSSIRLVAVHLGDTLEMVIAEKGQPTNKLQAGANTILTYSDGSIKLREGKVVASKTTKELTIANVRGVPPSSPHPAPTARTTPTSTDGWSTDYEAALAQAQNEKKKIFLLFTGSDWCIFCKRLEQEILSTSEFKDYAAGNLVLVKLDFPKNTPQSDQLKVQNNQLAQQNGITVYPTVLILDSAGKRIGKLGYMKDGPAGFIQKLQSF